MKNSVLTEVFKIWEKMNFPFSRHGLVSSWLADEQHRVTHSGSMITLEKFYKPTLSILSYGSIIDFNQVKVPYKVVVSPLTCL